MNRNIFSRRALIASCLCIMLQSALVFTPAFAADPADATTTSKPGPAKTAKKPAAKKADADTTEKSSAKPAAKAGKGKEKSAPNESGDAVQTKLNSFAQTTLASINRCIIPSASKKQVTQNPDGSFTCRYLEVDTKNVQTRYKKPEESTALTYVGYMTYDEIEYSSSGKTRNEAMAGPFNPSRRESLTELVKYVGGKWTY